MKKNPIEIRPVIFNSRQVELLQQGKLSTFIQVAKPKQYPSLLSVLWLNDSYLEEGDDDWLSLECPFGKTGHKLFVREKFALVQYKSFFENEWSKPITAYQNFDALPDVHQFASVRGLITTEMEGLGNFKVFKDRWLSPVCMSKVNSRHTLSITRLQLMRVQALRVCHLLDSGVDLDYYDEQRDLFHKDLFKNSSENYESNPLVWVAEFVEVKDVR